MLFAHFLKSCVIIKKSSYSDKKGCATVMKDTLEKLWDDYFAPDCAVIETEAEKALAQKVLQLQKTAHAPLTSEQIQAIEKYIDAICELESTFTKKAFFKGCEFAISFILESGDLKK